MPGGDDAQWIKKMLEQAARKAKVDLGPAIRVFQILEAIKEVLEMKSPRPLHNKRHLQVEMEM